MACWREKVGICRRGFLPEGFVPALVFIATCLNLLPTSYAQEVFPSIGCGYLGGHYGDTVVEIWHGSPTMACLLRQGTAPSSPLYIQAKVITYSCLLPVVGTQFISSVELRPLDATVYSYNGGQMRFPGDKFDGIRKVSFEVPMRLPVCSFNPSDTVISIQSPPDNTTRTDVYQVPRKVMQDDRLINDVLSNISDFSTNRKDYGVGNYERQEAVVFPLYSDYLYLRPAERFFSAIYARYLNSSELRTFPQEVMMSGVPGPVLIFSRPATMHATAHFIKVQSYEISASDAVISTQSPEDNTTRAYVYYVPPKVMQDGWLTTSPPVTSILPCNLSRDSLRARRDLGKKSEKRRRLAKLAVLDLSDSKPQGKFSSLDELVPRFVRSNNGSL